MIEHFEQTIKAVVAEIDKLQSEVNQKKRLVNMLCEQAGAKPKYEIEEDKGVSEYSLRGDEFFNQPLNKSIRKYMSIVDRPVTAKEIHDGLVRGGYDEFDDNEQKAIQGLRITLGKSSHTFSRLRNKKWGLNEWYPEKSGKSANKNKAANDSNNKTDDKDGDGGHEDTEGHENKREEVDET